MELGRSLEDYLKTILLVQEERGAVRAVDVARRLEVTKPSVSRAVRVLRQRGLLTEEEPALRLTEAGAAQARSLCARYRFLTDYLIAAGVDPDTAAREACRLEHDISEDTLRRLRERQAPEKPY